MILAALERRIPGLGDQAGSPGSPSVCEQGFNDRLGCSGKSANRLSCGEFTDCDYQLSERHFGFVVGK